MLKIIRTAIFLSIGLSVPTTFAQPAKSTAPPEFYVHLDQDKTVFYMDEYVGFRVMRAYNVSPKCDLGGSGMLQVLRNGNVIKSFRTGPVSRTGSDTVRGVRYSYYKWGLGSYNFLDSERVVQIGPKEIFQFRAICGGHRSEPSRPFHFSEWREPVDGIQAFVTPLKKAYKVGEPVRVRVTMRNIGRKSKWCPVPLPEDAYPRRFWVLEPHWTDSREPVDDNLTYSRGLRILKPGASQTAIFVLNHFKDSHLDRHRVFGNERGRFRLWLAVYADDDDDVPAKYRANLWRGEGLESNPFEIVIE